jgi:hypothetical protein
MTGLEEAKALVGAMLEDARRGYKSAKDAMTPGSDLFGRPNAEAFAEAGETSFLRADQLRMALDRIGTT